LTGTTSIVAAIVGGVIKLVWFTPTDPCILYELGRLVFLGMSCVPVHSDFLL
jgi:hypothetical protein